MKFFQFIQSKWLILGVGPSEHPLNGRIVIGLLLYSIGISLCCLFICRVADDLAVITSAIYQTAAMIFGVVCAINFSVRMAKFFEFIDSCECIVNKRLENPASSDIYTEVNQQIEKWSKIIHLFLYDITFVSFVAPKFILSYVLFYTSDVSAEAFELPFPMWYPFDWQTPTGYMIAIISQTLVAAYHFFIGSTVATFGISTYLLILSVVEDIRTNFDSANEGSKMKGKKSQKTKQLSVIFPRRLRLIHDFSEIFNPICLAVFICSLITICGTMMTVQLQLSSPVIDPLMLLLGIFAAFFAFGALLLVCDLIERLSNAFMDISDMVHQYDWYAFPVQMQQILLTIFIHINEPVTFKCFGSTTCSRSTFESVVKTSFSYFTVFRQLDI